MEEERLATTTELAIKREEISSLNKEMCQLKETLNCLEKKVTIYRNISVCTLIPEIYTGNVFSFYSIGSIAR